MQQICDEEVDIRQLTDLKNACFETEELVKN